VCVLPTNGCWLRLKVDGEERLVLRSTVYSLVANVSAGVLTTLMKGGKKRSNPGVYVDAYVVGIHISVAYLV
jgi:hypothetical protein